MKYKKTPARDARSVGRERENGSRKKHGARERERKKKHPDRVEPAGPTAQLDDEASREKCARDAAGKW